MASSSTHSSQPQQQQQQTSSLQCPIVAQQRPIRLPISRYRARKSSVANIAQDFGAQHEALEYSGQAEVYPVWSLEYPNSHGPRRFKSGAFPQLIALFEDCTTMQRFLNEVLSPDLICKIFWDLETDDTSIQQMDFVRSTVRFVKTFCDFCAQKIRTVSGANVDDKQKKQKKKQKDSDSSSAAEMMPKLHPLRDFLYLISRKESKYSMHVICIHPKVVLENYQVMDKLMKMFLLYAAMEENNALTKEGLNAKQYYDRKSKQRISMFGAKITHVPKNLMDAQKNKEEDKHYTMSHMAFGSGGGGGGGGDADGDETMAEATVAPQPELPKSKADIIIITSATKEGDDGVAEEEEPFDDGDDIMEDDESADPRDWGQDLIERMTRNDPLNRSRKRQKTASSSSTGVDDDEDRQSTVSSLGGLHEEFEAGLKLLADDVKDGDSVIVAHPIVDASVNVRVPTQLRMYASIKSSDAEKYPDSHLVVVEFPRAQQCIAGDISLEDAISQHTINDLVNTDTLKQSLLQYFPPEYYLFYDPLTEENVKLTNGDEEDADAADDDDDYQSAFGSQTTKTHRFKASILADEEEDYDDADEAAGVKILAKEELHIYSAQNRMTKEERKRFGKLIKEQPLKQRITLKDTNKFIEQYEREQQKLRKKHQRDDVDPHKGVFVISLDQTSLGKNISNQAYWSSFDDRLRSECIRYSFLAARTLFDPLRHSPEVRSMYQEVKPDELMHRICAAFGTTRDIVQQKSQGKLPYGFQHQHGSKSLASNDADLEMLSTVYSKPDQNVVYYLQPIRTILQRILDKVVAPDLRNTIFKNIHIEPQVCKTIKTNQQGSLLRFDVNKCVCEVRYLITEGKQRHGRFTERNQEYDPVLFHVNLERGLIYMKCRVTGCNEDRHWQRDEGQPPTVYDKLNDLEHINNPNDHISWRYCPREGKRRDIPENMLELLRQYLALEKRAEKGEQIKRSEVPELRFDDDDDSDEQQQEEAYEESEEEQHQQQQQQVSSTKKRARFVIELEEQEDSQSDDDDGEEDEDADDDITHYVEPLPYDSGDDNESDVDDEDLQLDEEEKRLIMRTEKKRSVANLLQEEEEDGIDAEKEDEAEVMEEAYERDDEDDNDENLSDAGSTGYGVFDEEEDDEEGDADEEDEEAEEEEDDE